MAGGTSPIAGPAVAGSGGEAGAGMRQPQGTTSLRRLNRVELANSLSALTGSTFAPDDLLPTEPQVQGFDTVSSALETTPTIVEQLMQAASLAAPQLGAATLRTCPQQADVRACELEGITRLARQTLRRPATPNELASYLAMYEEIEAREGGAIAMSAIVERLLSAPDFLYRLELGDSDGRLSEHELAARLAYTFWEAPPDQQLNALADGQALTASVASEVERLLRDPRAKQVLRRFLAQWLDTHDVVNVSKDPQTYPDFATLKPELVNELNGFVGVLVDDDAPVSAIVAAPFSVVGPTLGALYGVTASDVGSARVDLNGRPGLLTKAGFLALFGRARGSSPIRRGAFIRQRLLCLPLGSPPPGADALPSEAVPTTTTREFFGALTDSTACQGCHSLINPLGFALENFDGIGQYRATENGAPIDASAAAILNSSGTTVELDGAQQLVDALAREPQLLRCTATQWFRSRFGRIESGGDSAIVDAITTALGSGEHLLDVARAISRLPELNYAHFRRESP